MSRFGTTDYALEVAKGNITGTTVVNKFGSSPSTTDGNNWEVWDGARAYIWPTTAPTTYIRTENDTPAMDGLVVEIQGLDINYAPVTQTKAIDAATSTATEVALDTALLRVFRMKVLGSVVTTDPIWVGVTGVSAATAIGIIQVGMNQTLMAIYTIPAGKTAYMTSYYGDYVRDSVKDPDGIGFFLWQRDNDNGYAKQVKHQKGVPKQAAGFQHEFNPYYKITEKNDIFVTAEPDGAAAHLHAGFDLILVDD